MVPSKENFKKLLNQTYISLLFLSKFQTGSIYHVGILVRPIVKRA